MIKTKRDQDLSDPQQDVEIMAPPTSQSKSAESHRPKLKELATHNRRMYARLCLTASSFTTRGVSENTQRYDDRQYKKKNGLYNVLMTDYERIKSIIDVNVIRHISDWRNEIMDNECSVGKEQGNGINYDVLKEKAYKRERNLYDEIMKINLTFTYLWEIGCLSVFVCISNNQIKEFVPFISKNEDTTVKAHMLDAFRTEIGDMLEKSKEYAQETTVEYAKLKKRLDQLPTDPITVNPEDIELVKLDLGDPQQPTHHAILDRCILYGYEKRNHQLFDTVNYFHYAVYYDMLKKALESYSTLSGTDNKAYPPINSVFFINLFEK